MPDRPRERSAGPVLRRRSRARGMASAAHFSPCGCYRYRLSLSWDDAAPRLLVVMLNPSTADETLLDPTATRCVLRARALGFGAVWIVNLFALRATDPRALRGADDPVGPGNDAAILGAARRADAIPYRREFSPKKS